MKNIGVVSFAGSAIKRTYTLTATDGTLTRVTRTPLFTVSRGPASQVAFTTSLVRLDRGCHA